MSPDNVRVDASLLAKYALHHVCVAANHARRAEGRACADWASMAEAWAALATAAAEADSEYELERLLNWMGNLHMCDSITNIRHPVESTQTSEL